MHRAGINTEKNPARLISAVNRAVPPVPRHWAWTLRGATMARPGRTIISSFLLYGTRANRIVVAYTLSEYENNCKNRLIPSIVIASTPHSNGTGVLNIPSRYQRRAPLEASLRPAARPNAGNVRKSKILKAPKALRRLHTKAPSAALTP
ncbi:hypothetical protein EVAR_38750_1 [Eumeta japonica]|uniref:Uncharacterized protein n=1 Tax=Eumeta variegata TaxID=151549 RepID=A0A4C1WIS2_EUMVA|nr:hypothetical protein EVAR_38750_1 [Eumeta japonica]